MITQMPGLQGTLTCQGFVEFVLPEGTYCVAEFLQGGRGSKTEGLKVTWLVSVCGAKNGTRKI